MSIPLTSNEQKILDAFDRSTFHRKSTLTVLALLIPSETDIALEELKKKGLIEEEEVEGERKWNTKVYLTKEGRRQQKRVY